MRASSPPLPAFQRRSGANRSLKPFFILGFFCLPWLTFGQVLPGTQPLDWQGDLSERMMEGAHRFVERKIGESPDRRQRYWKRDFSSCQAYEASVEPNRQRFKKIIGVVDSRLPARMERFGDDENPALVAETAHYRVSQVRWPVLEGVTGEGLLLEPKVGSAGYVVALPDADQTPEQIAGLAPGIELEVQFARRLAERGLEVLVPVLIDRSSQWSGHPDFGQTDQTHREWIYRQAFHMGRHVIGYEVQKVLAAVDWFKQKSPEARVAVAGYGEGGLLALYAAAVDTRIDVSLISGYFGPRQEVWSEPIYRNVWGLLAEFGDAELATLIAPRDLLVEYSQEPLVTGHKGDLKARPFENVSREFQRIDRLLPPGFQRKELLSGTGGRPLPAGSARALDQFTHWLGMKPARILAESQLRDNRRGLDPGDRQRRQVRELEGHVQRLVRNSEHVRDRWFAFKVAPELADRTWSRELRHKTLAQASFVQGSKEYREYFWKEVMGRFDEPLLPPNARTRKIYDTEKWVGYEVVLDVWQELFAWGILLVPKDIQAGERRPVVVCQHGRTGLPQQVQHDQLLRWLETLPFVDPQRMAFYGLSYGGETAVRAPTILEKYALSICSGDFNSWTYKVAAIDQPFSFMYTEEWEMPYFNLGQTFDYAEMGYLMIPRPFMVERGHHDHVARDQWVAHEYAKLRRVYVQLGLEDKTEIEYFNGGHTINAEGTFKFLHKHLNWPEK